MPIFYELLSSWWSPEIGLHLLLRAHISSGSGAISLEKAHELISMATPYAEGILAAGDLLPHLACQVAPERPAPEPHDFSSAYPFWAALDSLLTTYMVNECQVVEEPLATAEASTSVGEQAVVDGGEAVPTETTAEDVDAVTAQVTK
jgi:hypothetical protein